MKYYNHAVAAWVACCVAAAASVKLGLPGDTPALMLLWLSGLACGLAVMFLVVGVVHEDRPETVVRSEDEGPDPGEYCCQCSSPYVVFGDRGDKECGDCGKPLIPF